MSFWVFADVPWWTGSEVMEVDAAEAEVWYVEEDVDMKEIEYVEEDVDMKGAEYVDGYVDMASEEVDEKMDAGEDEAMEVDDILFYPLAGWCKDEMMEVEDDLCDLFGRLTLSSADQVKSYARPYDHPVSDVKDIIAQEPRVEMEVEDAVGSKLELAVEIEVGSEVEMQVECPMGNVAVSTTAPVANPAYFASYGAPVSTYVPLPAPNEYTFGTLAPPAFTFGTGAPSSKGPSTHQLSSGPTTRTTAAFKAETKKKARAAQRLALDQEEEAACNAGL